MMQIAPRVITTSTKINSSLSFIGKMLLVRFTKNYDYWSVTSKISYRVEKATLVKAYKLLILTVNERI